MNSSQNQILHTAEEDASSPTVLTRWVLLSATIDSSESRFIATCHITGAFLMADMEKFIILVLCKKGIYALIHANAKYEQFIKKLKNSKQVVYLNLSKAMHGCLNSAWIFWEHLSIYLLAKLKFTQKYHILCIVNKQINSTTFTIAWYFDNLKISHKKKK